MNLISAVYQKENFLSRRQRADVLNSTLDETKKTKMLQNLSFLENQQINIMITGAGKSSTINALFDANVANVGTGVDPETMNIKWYKLKNLILWDTPGLGDGAEADARHAKNIVKKLNELDANGNPLIDLVLVILDSSSRDLGTSYDLINNVIIPNLGGKTDRISVAINQAD
ncbi:MAG: 50S ribosome-binding GTPase, partial [Selenomonadaceae bacterium]|nr:50S ribosome-binding GTPase [Selenomonadaceae bacterium]